MRSMLVTLAVAVAVAVLMLNRPIRHISAAVAHNLSELMLLHVTQCLFINGGNFHK